MLDQTRNDPRCIHLKFENIFSPESGPAEIARILEFFGFRKRATGCADATLKALDEPKNQTRHSADNREEGATAERACRVEEITKCLRAELGYGEG